MGNEVEILEKVTSSDYKYGFTTDVEMDLAPKGLSEETIKMISQKKKEPESMLEWRLKAYKLWLDMKEPKWAKIRLSANRLSGYHILCRSKEKKCIE